MRKHALHQTLANRYTGSSGIDRKLEHYISNRLITDRDPELIQLQVTMKHLLMGK